EVEKVAEGLADLGVLGDGGVDGGCERRVGGGERREDLVVEPEGATPTGVRAQRRQLVDQRGDGGDVGGRHRDPPSGGPNGVAAGMSIIRDAVGDWYARSAQFRGGSRRSADPGQGRGADMRLTSTDEQLLSILREDARAPTAEIARRLQL